MSYTIYKTNGLQLLTLLDGTLDTSTGLNLVGKNYINYGTVQNENFVWLLENQASNTPPLYPLTGQLWYDTGTSTLKYFDGTAFHAIAAAGSSSSNVGALEAELQSSISGVYASLTANVSSLTNLIIASNTSLKAYVDANAAVQSSAILIANTTVNSLSANIGSFYTWANTNFGTSNYANINVETYLPHSTTISNHQGQINSLSANIATNTSDIATLFSTQGTSTTPSTSSNNTTIATTAFVQSILPTGGIILWHGSDTAIPYGWRLCDGTNNTPNLNTQVAGVYYIKKII